MTLTPTTEIVPAPEAAPSALTAIRARDITKTFEIPQDQLLTLKERVLHPVQAFRGAADTLRAVNG